MLPRTFVIGDIHGGLLALKQLLHKVGIQPSDTLIFIGDYVDGWSQSAGVISYLLQLRFSCHCIFLRGNHDAYCEQWLETGIPEANWLKNGGSTTINSYQQVPEDIRHLHRQFFRELLNFYVDNENRLFVHAGFISKSGVRHEPDYKNFYWDRTLWQQTLQHKAAKGEQGPARLGLYKSVYIGHTPTLNSGSTVPVQAYNLWNVDTGAGYTGPLSALEIHTEAVYQSDIVRWFYPNETGRNGGAQAAPIIHQLFKRLPQ